MRKKIDWAEVQNRRSSGEPVTKIAKDLGVSGVTIYARTKAGGKGRKAAVSRSGAAVHMQSKPRRAVHRRFAARAGHSNGSSGAYRFIIADLRKQQEELRSKAQEMEPIIKGLEALDN